MADEQSSRSVRRPQSGAFRRTSPRRCASSAIGIGSWNSSAGCSGKDEARQARRLLADAKLHGHKYAIDAGPIHAYSLAWQNVKQPGAK
nr:hypothetical protein OG999_24580 [Streptomyces sp. NBC_00886]